MPCRDLHPSAIYSSEGGSRGFIINQITSLLNLTPLPFVASSQFMLTSCLKPPSRLAALSRQLTMAAATANGTTSSAHANGAANGTSPKIHLYTNHRCPYAHRAHIALEELKLPFEETIIDLDTPRPQWYLDINPRGKSPPATYLRSIN